MPAYHQEAAPPAGAPAGGAVPADAAQVTVAQRLQAVDDAIAGLADLPVDAQVAVFTDLHQQLTAALDVTAAAAPGGEAAGPRTGDPATPKPAGDQDRRRPNGPAPQYRPGPPSPRSR
jgi:hypothetical protein